MGRRDEFQGQTNPATKFLEWKSDDRTFKYYDKEKKVNIEEKQIRFVVLKEMHTVKGFNDANQCGVFSNEVERIGTEPLTVRTFKGGIKVEGLYKDNKAEINAIGGVYHKSIYAMDEAGEIINISLKGAAVSAWGEFTKKNRRRLADEWVELKGADEHKKGKVKYTTPVFAFYRSLDEEQGKAADRAYDALTGYLDYYKQKESYNPDDDDVENDIDDLDKTFGSSDDPKGGYPLEEEDQAF